MRVFKRLIQILAVVVILAGAGLIYAYHLTTRTPDGYRPGVMTEDQIRVASQRVDAQKLPELVTYAAEAQARARAAILAQQKGQPVDASAVQPMTVAFTQDELNATLVKWWETAQWRSKVEAYLTKPFVRIEDGRLILMGTVPEYGKVISVFFEPRLENGQMRCDVTSVRLGVLPIPDVLLAKQRDKLVAQLKSGLPGLQAQAKMDDSGLSNTQMLQAALAKLMLSALDQRPMPPAVFVWRDQGHAIPLKLTQVEAKEGEVTFTVTPLATPERGELATMIKQPYEKEKGAVQ